ncbi:adenosine receptor A1-like [Varanus komodoensis]|uniref:adenosine receptor A1-like n=1 Tax=Varanus komodoensis TaxID=61221 RepID=UPI001CF7D52D|nr:adenosine receptor A1-like [Varanus komodoensis]
MDAPLGFAVLEGVLAVAILAINLLVCATIYLHKELRCIPNCLIACLAVADLGVGALAIPFSVVLSLELALRFYTCLFLTCFPLVTTQFSILLLLVIAINTHLKVRLPNSYAVRMKKGWMATAVVFCWLISLLIGLLPMMGWNRFQQYVEAGNSTLTFSFPSERAALVIIAGDIPYGGLLSKVYPGPQNFSSGKTPSGHQGLCCFTSIFSPDYLACFLFTCTLLPLAAMLGIYVDLFRVVRGHFQALWPAKRRELRMARTLFLLLGVFCLCWGPLQVIYCVQLLCPSCQTRESLYRLAVLLSHLNSLANPLVYALRKKDLALALRSVFLHRVLRWPRLKACCCPNPKVHPQV